MKNTFLTNGLGGPRLISGGLAPDVSAGPTTRNTFLTFGLGGRRLVTVGYAQSFTAPTGPVGPLYAAPDDLDASATTRIDFYGTGTTWTTFTPSFAASGVPTTDGAWSVGLMTIDSDTHAHFSVTTGPTEGTVFFTASPGGSVVAMDVMTGEAVPWQVMRPGHLPRTPRLPHVRVGRA